MPTRARSRVSIDESFINLGQRGFLGRTRGMGKQPYVDRYIGLMNSIPRTGRTAAYLSMNHPYSPERIPREGKRISGRGESEPSGGGGESRAAERANRGMSINNTENLQYR